MLPNEWQPNILDRLYQIMFKIIILSQIGADRYQKLIFEILLLSPPLGELCRGVFTAFPVTSLTVHSVCISDIGIA